MVVRIEQLKQEKLKLIAILSRLQREIAAASTTLKILQKELKLHSFAYFFSFKKGDSYSIP